MSPPTVAGLSERLGKTTDEASMASRSRAFRRAESSLEYLWKTRRPSASVATDAVAPSPSDGA